jgi:glycosyltransferase involved in cell wall biosynthesis
MMRLFINALGASAGAGLTYLHNVIPQLTALPHVQTTLAIQPQLRNHFEGLTNLYFAIPDKQLSTARRFWFEQFGLPAQIRKSGADVLISTGNFAVRNSPVPQILLSGNSLYTSQHFRRDLLARREFFALLDTGIKGVFARRSVSWADCTVAPSQAFATELRRWTRREVVAIHHGFDRDTFFRDEGILQPRQCELLQRTDDNTVRLLFVSHYNYYRNFETLLRAIPILRKILNDRQVRLFLTCMLQKGTNPGAYDPTAAARLIKILGIDNEVVQLGAVPYHLLHHVYRACDIYVTPAYTETFAHPLVEAMACGLPVIASDLPVHREVCQKAALYFPRFSPEALAQTAAKVAGSPSLAKDLSIPGQERSGHFSWRNHVQALLELATALTAHNLGFLWSDGLVQH